MWGRQRAGIAPVLLGALIAVGATGTAQAAITISGANTPVDEGGTTNVTVTRDSGLSASTVTVRLGGNGDAPASCPEDASVTAARTCSTTVSFDALQLTPVGQQVAIAVPADGLDEAAEERLEVEALEQGAVVARKTLSIADVDAPPTLSIADAASVVEGDAGGAALEFALTLSAVSSFPVKAKVALGGTAAAGGDVVPRGFTDTITIPAGTKRVVLTLAVVPDDLDEPDEEATLTLSDLENATPGARTTAKGTLVNDDVPAVSIADVTGNEGTGADRTPFAFAVTLSNPSTRTVAISANSADLQAKAGEDYDAVAQRLTFAPGVTSQTVVAGVVADAVREDVEAFVVHLSDPSGLTIARDGAFGGITDDDRASATPVPGTTGAGGVALPAAAPSGRSRRGTTTRKLRLSKLTFKKPGSLSGKLECPPASRGCKGRITAFSVPQRRSKVRSLRRELKLGTVTFDVAAGRAQTLTIRLSKTMLTAIRRGKRVRVKAFAVSRTPGGEVSTADAKGVVKP